MEIDGQQWANAANTLVALVTTYGLRVRGRDRHPGDRMDDLACAV